MSTLSKRLTATLSKDEQRTNGIYFTPPADVELVVKKIFAHDNTIRDILEPSCGSCEFIQYIDDRYKNLNIDGYEINDTIFQQIKGLRFRNKVSLHNRDFLNTSFNKKKYDLIVGNPPYYETTHTDESGFFNTQKINIYLLFIVKSLRLLKKNGILAFVLPNNFLNNKYCNALREHLRTHYKALSVHLFLESHYLNTSQTTCLLMLQNITKRGSWNPYSIKISDTVFFNTPQNIKLLKSYKSNLNLNNLGYSVKVGNVLWNEHKDKLSATKRDKSYARLLYSTDIENGKVTIHKHPEKKPYIKLNKPTHKGDQHPVLVVNRGHGTGKYQFAYAIYDEPHPVLFENHVLVISPPSSDSAEQAKKKLERIKQSFDDKRTSMFIETLFTNNAINVHEMKHIIPIYDAKSV